MKKNIALALQTAFCILLTTTAFAQSGRTPQTPTNESKSQTEQQRGNRPEGQRQSPEIPNLTDEQKGQLQTIRQQSREQIEAARNDTTLSDDERRSRIDSIRQTSRAQSQGVLTPEQREAANHQRANGRGNGEGRSNNANGQGSSGKRPQMGGQNGGFGGPRGGQGGQGGSPRGGGGRGGGRP